MLLGNEYILQKDDKFIIQREFNGKIINFGTFESLNDAKYYRNKLENKGWAIPLKNADNNIVEENIIRLDDLKFKIFRILDDKLYEFGPYDSIDKARVARLNLKSNGWESDLYHSNAKYGKYINKKDNRYYISRNIKSKYVSFGSYDTLNDAVNARDSLVLNNWGKYNLKPNQGYGNFISKNGKQYKIQKTINGVNRIFGYYNTLEEATEARNYFVSKNWDVPYHEPVNEKYIYKSPRGFQIYKRIDGNIKFFGSYDTLNDAIEKRNQLIKNNWNLKDNFEDNFYEKYIHYDGKYYTIERNVYNDIRVYGVFKSKDLASNEKNKLIDKQWVGPYRIKTKKYPYGKNIVPFDYIFNVEIEVEGIFKDYGPFLNFKDAVAKCEEFENLNLEKEENIDTKNNSVTSNEKIFDDLDNVMGNLNDININYGENNILDIRNKLLNIQNNLSNKNSEDNNINLSDEFILFSDVKNIYDNINLVEEENIPFPQVDVFQTFIDICEKIFIDKMLTKNDIMNIFSLNIRQYNFYIAAGKYLNLIENTSITSFNLTEKGNHIFSLNKKDRNLKLVELILEHKPFYDVFTEYLKNNEVPNVDVIFEILKSSNIYNINSDVTLRRRSKSVKSWIKWIVGLYNNS